MWDIGKNAFRSLRRKGLRTFLTMSGIMVGVLMLFLISVISDTGVRVLQEEMDNMGMNGLSVSTDGADITQTKLTVEHLEAIGRVSSVDAAMPLALEYGMTTVRDLSIKSMVCGIGAGANHVISLELLHGRLLRESDLNGRELVCVVDEALAHETYQRENIVGKTLGLIIDDKTVEFTVVGVSAAGSNLLKNFTGYIPSMVYIPYTTLQSLTGKSKFNQIAVRVDPAADTEVVRVSIENALDRVSGKRGLFKAENLSNQREQLGRIMTMIQWVFALIGAVSLIVSGVGIMTTMLAAVNERTKEIGIKKAIGASRRHILAEFLTESAGITLLGGLLGLGIGIAGVMIASLWLPVEVAISWSTTAWILAFTVFIGAVFGAYPAVKASRLQPVEALRAE